MRSSFKKTIAILLAVVLAFSVMTVGVVGVSAADGEMKVTVSSTVPEFFPPSTQYVDQKADKLTVTYWFNLEDYFMVNNQWQLTYDPLVLQYDTEDGVNQTGSSDKPTYLIYKFPDKENGSMEFNPVCERKGVMKGNITYANGFECYNKGKLPFLSITFKIINHNASETSVNLDMQVMQVRHKDISQYITPVDFINHSEIVKDDVPFTADKTYTAAYEGEYNAHYGETPEHLDNFWIGGYNLSLRSNIAMQVFVEDTKIAEYDSFWVTATADGKGTTVLQPHHTIGSGTTLKHVFLYNKIYSNEMYKNVSFELHATKDGVEYYGDAYAWSIKSYVFEGLSKEDIDSKPAYKTLLVELLNYGAASQTYTNSTEPLVNADLTSEQQDSTIKEFTCTNNNDYTAVIQDPSAMWLGIRCVLGSSIAPKLACSINSGKSIDDIYVRAVMNGQTYEIRTFAPVENQDNQYTVVFDKVNADQLATPIEFTLMENGNAISHTYRFDIESYAAETFEKPSSKDTDIVSAMVRYGRAALAYVS